jgi:hypothetical protein
MEVVSKNAGFLTNMEVSRLLHDRQRERSLAREAAKASAETKPDGRARYVQAILRKKRLRTLRWMEDEVKGYLSRTAASTQEGPGVAAFCRALAEKEEENPSLALTKAERMQIINLRTTQPVELHLVLEECAERFTDEQVDEIARLAEEHLPSFTHPDVVAQEAQDAVPTSMVPSPAA